MDQEKFVEDRLYKISLGIPHHFIFFKDCLSHYFVSQILLCSKYRSRSSCPNDRSSCPEMFCEKGALKHFAKCTGKIEFNSVVFLGVLQNF